MPERWHLFLCILMYALVSFSLSPLPNPPLSLSLSPSSSYSAPPFPPISDLSQLLPSLYPLFLSLFFSLSHLLSTYLASSPILYLTVSILSPAPLSLSIHFITTFQPLSLLCSLICSLSLSFFLYLSLFLYLSHTATPLLRRLSPCPHVALKLHWTPSCHASSYTGPLHKSLHKQFFAVRSYNTYIITHNK